MSELTVGVVGLGRMGGGMAGHLVESGVDVRGYDVVPEAREGAAERGVTIDGSAAELAGQSDVVVTSLPNSEIVRESYLGEGGIAAGADDLVAIEASTIDPATTEALAEEVATLGVTLVDAPVSGGPEGAASGTLTLFIGGDASVIDSPPARPVLDAISKKSFHVGDVGAGHTTKLLNNTMSMGNLLLAMEAASLGAARGLEGDRIFEALRNAGGSSNQFEKRMPCVLNRNFEPRFTVSFARKDLGLALEAGSDIDHSMPVTALIHQLYTKAVSEGYGEEDAVAVAKLFERDQLIEADEHVDESYEGY
ncbi:MAG: NAD(P)-dependent oxidoreductase [Halobacteriota archaeon]|uniref:NAD(P)-dependent oxidoreductase n=1 Tax=Natronomonas sp. TaxID=2184060 RepID=UPI003974A313